MSDTPVISNSTKRPLPWNATLDNTGPQMIPCGLQVNSCQGQHKTWFQTHLVSLLHTSPAQTFPATAWRLLMSSVKLKANSKETQLPSWLSAPSYINPMEKFLPGSHTCPAPPLVSHGLLQDLSLHSHVPQQVTAGYGPRLDGERCPKHFYLGLLPQFLMDQLFLKVLRLQQVNILIKLKGIFEE